jgi:hypothetical protein
MLIGKKFHTAGNSIRYEIDYSEWLERGRTLNPASCAAVLEPGSTVTDVTVDQLSVTPSKLYFFVTGGSINEVFTVQATGVDSIGETVIDTVQFTGVAP